MAAIASWKLFEDLREAQHEMLRMDRMRAQRSGLFGQEYRHGSFTAAWAPAVDIYERKDAYLVAAELPGVRIDDIEITFEDGLLTIQGQRNLAPDSSEERVHRAERRYGAFRRSITLPLPVNSDSIEASTQDGVLQIMVPKAAGGHAKRIEVHAGGGRVLPAADDEGETRN
jgi:HSP20 family protein